MNDLVLEFLENVPENNKTSYQEMAEKAIMLGYKPKRDKTKSLCVSFISSKYKTTLLRFVIEKGPSFRLKFYATKDYSEIFDKSIKWIIEKFNYKYVGCYGCGRCKKNTPEGYSVVYDDGRKYFRCGFELIEIRDLNNNIKDEVLKLMENQTKYYEEKMKEEHPTTTST